MAATSALRNALPIIWTVLLVVFLSWPAVPISAQIATEAWEAPPIGGTWEPVRSLGQPARFRAFGRLGYGIDRSGAGDEAGPLGSVGVYRDFFNPVYGALGLSLQAYVGQRGEDFDGGVQVHLESPATFAHLGVDWNARLKRIDPALGVTVPLRRGGWPLPGSQFRVDWIPGRAQSLVLGLTVPLRRPLAGRTRSRTVDVELPAPPRVEPGLLPPPGSPLEAVLDELGESMEWLAGLHSSFWLTDFASLDHEKTVSETREALADFRSRLDARASLMPERATYEREVESFHLALDRALGIAVGEPEATAEHGRRFADQLRRLTLEEVVLPYNRTIGRYKQPDRLDGLAARARARFIAWMELDAGLDRRAGESVVAVVDIWFRDLERLRARMARVKRDSRMQWLPLALVLRPDEHETQEQIDAIIELALGRGFERGNELTEIDALAFQHELRRSIHEAETYHVLWVHDYRGRNPLGDPDRIGYAQTTDGYLRSLLERVRAYDRTGRLPVYLLMVDQYFYETNDSRLWLDLLEDPLAHDFRLSIREDDPERALEMEAGVRQLQDSLRTAVAESRRMQAEAGAFGEDWIRNVVKVHVNVTNPTDFTFRSRRLMRRGPPIGADNLMRDHRKIVIRDVTEEDPSSGEVILAGVGVGEHYATPTWDDRGLILRGPAALEAKERARDVLERHNLTGRLLPPPLRPRERSRDYLGRVDAMEASGATARVMQVHNRTGWGEKDATFVQMLIYDLVPAGTVIYVPDSLWTSYEWMAQLVSAALRGCLVYVVAPSLANAPSSDFPVMSTMQELVTRLVLVGEAFEDVITAAGGQLRVGLYTREAPLDDVPGVLMDVDSTFSANPFLQDIFPFSSEATAVLRRYREEPSADVWNRAAVVDVVDRLPKMHRKTQLVVSASVLRELAASEAMPGFLEASFEHQFEPVRALGAGETRGPASPQVLVREYHRLTEEGRAFDAPPVLYFLTGSVNKNVRSMALDGEVLAAVAGPWALHAYLDFVLLSGGVTWIRDAEEVEVLLPPYSTLKRIISRWLYRVL
jgi:hypothetical protein